MADIIKVMVVDDSAVVRQAMTEILEADGDIKVIATAADPFFAVEKLEKEVPDVITLDIEMPRMDGLTFLKKLMQQHPIPVVICSSLVEDGAEETVKALEYGAVEIIYKPKLGAKQFIRESRIRICDAVRAAAQARIATMNRLSARVKSIAPADQGKKVDARKRGMAADRVVVIGSSTGGTDALKVILQDLAVDCPAILVVQHMPKGFTGAFARRLDKICQISVAEAVDGQRLLRGQALIALGDSHLLLKKDNSGFFAEVKEGPLVCRHRPSVDVLFRSAARYGGANVTGVMLTGMGSDGAAGMLELRRAGALTLAQDEETSVVYGMAREAIRLNAVREVVELGQIAARISARS